MQWNGLKLSRIVLVMVVVIATIYFFYLVREVLFTFGMGALLAYLLFRPVKWIESQGIKRIWAIILLYVIVLTGISFLLAFALPGVVRELTGLAELIPQYANQAQDMAGRIQAIDMPVKLGEVVNDNVSRVENYIYEGLKGFVNSLYNFLGKIFAVVFSPILAFYIMNDWEKIRDRFLKLFSPRGRQELMVVFGDIDMVLIEFLKGHLLVATFVGTMIGLSAALLGVEFSLLLGILSGVTNLIPYFGAFLGGIPAVAIAFSESLRLAIYMTLAILIVQQVESNLVTPKIIGDRLGMHPLLIVFALLAGGKLMGIWGMLFAVPVAAVLKVVLYRVYLRVVE